VITLPVSDVERAMRFYVDQVGFTRDVDYSPNEIFRVVQLTPPGSNSEILILLRKWDCLVSRAAPRQSIWLRAVPAL